MQALKSAGLALLLLIGLPALAQSEWVEVSLGEYAVPRACPGVGLTARALPTQKQAPQQQQQPPQQYQVVTWDAGRISLAMRAWPEQRLRDKQSMRNFKACAVAVKDRVPAAQLIGAERAAEAALKAGIDQCLAERQQSITVRTVVLSRGSMQCP